MSDLKFDDEHHIEITVRLVDGPQDWTRPPDIPGTQMIGGIKTAATLFMYEEVVRAHMQLATERILKSLEDEGVLIR